MEMKKKLPDGTFEKCPDCKKEFSSNECETHATNRQQMCYFCHLQQEHLVEWKDDKPNDKAELGDGGKV
jgi:hypothetical protein